MARRGKDNWRIEITSLFKVFVSVGTRTFYFERRGEDLAISKEKKEEIVADLIAKFSRSKAAILTDYRGLTVVEISQLRNQMREVKSGYHVVKNRLTKLAIEEAGLPVPESLLTGPTAIGFCYEDAVAPAKVLMEFAKESKVLSIKGGLLGGKVITADDVLALAALPSRETLLAQVIAGMQAPLAGLVNVLKGPTRALIYILQARAKQLEG